MTEEEWATCTDPVKMLEFIVKRGTATERKARLFVAACCRRIWHLATDDRARAAVEVGERFADGVASEQVCEAAARVAIEARKEASSRVGDLASASGWGPNARAAEALRLALNTCDCAATGPYRPGPASKLAFLPYIAPMASLAVSYANGGAGVEEVGDQAEQAGQVVLLRDIFGNPFRPFPAIDPVWLNWQGGIVKNLAEAAYENRSLPDGTLDRDRLAVLADALEEAGCTDADLLDHLREPGPHVRGCWVLDLILGMQ
jgi:hypothetical protein